MLSTSKTYTSSLNDCLAFASLFDNTCNSTSTVQNFTKIATKNKTCTGTDYCMDGAWVGETGNCSFTRKTCVTCRVDSSNTTLIRIQTNGMPNFCWKNSAWFPWSNITIDQEVVWNMNITTPTYSPTNQSAVNTVLCDKEATKPQNLPSTYKRTVYLDSDTPAVGLSLSGGFIAPGLSGDGWDMFYPNLTYPTLAAEIAADSGIFRPPQFDSCMSHIDHTGFIHSHVLPGCNAGGDKNYASNLTAVACQNNDTTCRSNITKWAL